MQRFAKVGAIENAVMYNQKSSSAIRYRAMVQICEDSNLTSNRAHNFENAIIMAWEQHRQGIAVGHVIVKDTPFNRQQSLEVK